MGDKNAPLIGLLSQRSMFCLFTFVSILFIFSWLFVLRSTGRPNFIDNTLLPNSKLLAVFDNGARNLSDDNVPRKTILVKCVTDKVKLKVFMYDLPPEFHFGLLGWKGDGKSVWPDIRTNIPHYPGGLNLQHSIEYFLTLDLLSSEFASNLDGHSAIRVRNSSEADVIFVPFFSCISYNRYSRLKPHEKNSYNKVLQEKLVKYVTAQEEWKKSGGRDHIILAHHPNSLLDARTKLWPGMFILSDFGRYPPNIANVKKDIIAPYKHVIKSYVNDTSDFDSRPTLLYFQGAIYRKDVSSFLSMFLLLIDFNYSWKKWRC